VKRECQRERQRHLCLVQSLQNGALIQPTALERERLKREWGLRQREGDGGRRGARAPSLNTPLIAPSWRLNRALMAPE
jgi:hypothetical protein